MIKAISKFKRGLTLEGTIYEDTDIKTGAPYFAEVFHMGEQIRSPRFADEDDATMWVDNTFGECIGRRRQ
jgi:hypothetical protein